jgi:glutathione synthase/RimK-type ligase-like ATP-grasp enzyme
MLLVSTDDDRALSLFYSEPSLELIEPLTVRYDASPNEIYKILQQEFQYIYFRDPFNDSSISQDLAKDNTKKILNSGASAYIVDHISSYNDLKFEDKWRQYNMFADYMPSTEILNSNMVIDFKTKIIKKRFSSRSRGIINEEKDFPLNSQAKDYLVQSRLDIETEYRAFMVGEKIIGPLAIKTRRRSLNKIQVTGLEKNIDPGIINICNAVYAKTGYDLMGLDIAKTNKGFMLIEINRSCQFKGYLKKSDINLAVSLNKRLLSLNK